MLNDPALVRGFGQYELVGEGEERHTLFGHEGKAKILLFVNHGRMGSYNDALARGVATHAAPDNALVRKPASRPGGAASAMTWAAFCASA